MTSVTFLKPRRNHGPEIVRQEDGLVLLTADIAVEEVHEITAETTDHPVESLGDITDHIQTRPRTLRMSLIFSATPINKRLREVGRVDKVHQLFLQLMEDRLPVNIATSLEFYRNMALTRYSVNKDADTGQMLSVDLDFKQVRVASSSTVPIPPELLASTFAGSGQSEENVGTQSTEDLSDANAEGSNTVLQGLFGIGRR